MKPSPLGVWIIGAYGAVSTCTIIGALGMADGLCDSSGMVSASPLFEKLQLMGPENFVFGGWDVRPGSLKQTACLLAERDGILSGDLVKKLEEKIGQVEKNIRPGCLFQMDQFSQDLGETALCTNPEEGLQKIQNDLKNFQKENNLEKVVVVNLASTQASPSFLKDLKDLDTLKKMISQRMDFPTSVLYAYGALDLGMAYLNFTPSPGSEIPALQELALERGVPHAGKDGKTGETLIKTVLAPMFEARNLEVLSWIGYNILGNMDGQALELPERNRTKVDSKASSLQSLLPHSKPCLKVGIEYVPSLGDWKTAWDFIHFRGFMNTTMSLQFTWQASDSMLAAPLVLDLIRLLHYGWSQGEKGLCPHLSSFFKSPIGGETHHFYQQFEMLRDYVKGHSE